MKVHKVVFFPNAFRICYLKMIQAVLLLICLILAVTGIIVFHSHHPSSKDLKYLNKIYIVQTWSQLLSAYEKNFGSWLLNHW